MRRFTFANEAPLATQGAVYLMLYIQGSMKIGTLQYAAVKKKKKNCMFCKFHLTFFSSVIRMFQMMSFIAPQFPLLASTPAEDGRRTCELIPVWTPQLSV